MASVAQQREEALQRALLDAQSQLDGAVQSAAAVASRAAGVEEELTRARTREAAASSELTALRGQGDVKEAYARLQQSFAKLQGECRWVGYADVDVFGVHVGWGMLHSLATRLARSLGTFSAIWCGWVGGRCGV